MNAAFEHLPLELRFEIASQISAFDDFTNFRHMDRPNFSLLPFYGVANTFLPTDNEKAFVNWISSQLSDYYSDNHLVSSVIERYDPEFEGLAMPLRYERKGDTEDGFAEYCRFLEKAKQVAVRRTPASTVKPRGISITHSSYDMACLKLERLRTFLWHPDGFIFNDTTRQQLDDWCMAVEETFRLASRFHHLPANEFSFHKAVAEVLVHHIRDLYDRFFEPEANWEDEHVAFEGGQDLVFWIQELFTFVMRVRAWDDLANGIEGKPTPYFICWRFHN